MNTIKTNELKFKLPVRILVSSASQSGKTEKLLLFIKYRDVLFANSFQRIVWFTPSSVPLTQEFERRLREVCDILEIDQDISPNMDFARYSSYNNDHTLFVFDDLSSQIVNSKQMLHFFMAASHHHRISCLFTLQSQFMVGRFTKQIVRQCGYRFLMRDRADILSLSHLSRQLLPGASGFLGKCFEWLQIHEPDPYRRYLLLDYDNNSVLGDNYRVRSRIFPNEAGKLEPIVFSPAMSF